ncbi:MULTISPECIES: MarR family transcriptional regulator [Lelliottia]|jgi:hypothetical protein|uniref:MarR family transcriptional regulator n=1 Tax=Lelliottia aquatilis TaxID=2080838 RepID=A0ABX5A4R7_9ENTR|nr:MULTISPECIES: MarR family transcriptional regulator [Lelliottia]NTZ47236.1 MarR family transcriptional regulator [Lelliottia aquatilis]POZ25278.1 MarR family transcriptional regulator [Lelliottia aquatilis]POZ28454.1 MarR family transcriptional regulator [Lelliottia sp. 7254-16]POZ30251.1 MarR family transcriptional regulator [Lelliottia aquatilis]POZ35815.1 MarR family transcriptional regulator [Lelliottia aquatilis]
MITTIELNVLKVLASKDYKWTWMSLDRTLHAKNIPGFCYVVDIVNSLESKGLVNFEDSGHPSMPYYRVSEKGHQLLSDVNESQVD